MLTRIFQEQDIIRNYIKNYNKDGFASTIIELRIFLQYFEEVIESSTSSEKPKNFRTLINYLTLMVFCELYESEELFS